MEINSTKDKKQTAYKDTPIGKIPADWEVKRLGELGNFSKGRGILKDQVKDRGLPCIRYGEIYTSYDYVTHEFKSFIDEEVAKESKEIKKGDVLFAGSGETVDEIGKSVAYIGEQTAYAGGDVIVFTPNQDLVSSDSLSYTLDIDIIRKQKRYMGQGNSVVHIYPSDLAKIQLPLPPLPEQKRIAEVLSTWDQAIQLTEQLIRQKEQRKKWLMQNLLTGKMRLKGFSGEWKEYRLKSICKISKGEQLNKIDLEKTGIYPSYSGGITPSGYTDKWNTNENTIIISEGGNSCGYVNYVTSKFWCGGHCYALLNLKEIINRDFLFQALKHQEHKIMKLRVGSGLPNVQKKDLENYPIVIPSIEEQTAIAEVLQTADKEIELLKAKAEQLKEQKKGLMQQLLTGKKRLNLNLQD